MDKPYFLWDYNLNESDVKKILHQGSEPEKRWLVARILEHAHFDDVFKYLNLREIIESFPKLKLRPTTRRYWQRVLSVWGHNV
jgi:hypothetical protein